MRVKVDYSSTRDLQSDLAATPPEFIRKGSAAVRKNVAEGLKVTQGLAQSRSGRHGGSYYKRYTSEMTGALVGEFGLNPDDTGTPVGGGWRHGPGNTDLPDAADVIGPKFAKDIDDMIDDLPAFRER